MSTKSFFAATAVTLAALAAPVMLALSPNASALAIDDSQQLCYIEFGLPSGAADQLAYINHCIGMAAPSSDTALGQNFTRSSNVFGVLPTATGGADQGTTGCGAVTCSVNLGMPGQYSYLYSKYDGPNYGVILWWVGNLSGIITIPNNPPGGGNALSHYTLYTPTPSTGGPSGSGTVPEPSSSGLALLGVALLGGVLFKRRRVRPD